MDQLTPSPHLPARTHAAPAWRAGPTWSDEPALRIGDVERATACDALADHFAAGRLDPAELEDRLARAMAARSAPELAALFRDLEPRRRVAPVPTPVPSETVSSAVPVLASVLVMALLLAGGMLMALGVYSFAFFVAALVGGTATAVVGGCAVAIGHRTLRRR